jgi:hypothetical protein
LKANGNIFATFSGNFFLFFFIFLLGCTIIHCRKECHITKIRLLFTIEKEASFYSVGSLGNIDTFTGKCIQPDDITGDYKKAFSSFVVPDPQAWGVSRIIGR